MAESQSNAYKNERRIQARILTREALFVNEYLQTKYKNIYNEAAGFYNRLNKQYAKKPDLRKTLEFRLWKNQIAAEKDQPVTHIPRPKQYSYNRMQYKDISILPPTEMSKEKRNTANLLTASLNIPLMAIPQHDTANGIVIQEDHQPTDPPAVDSISTRTTVIQEDDQVATPVISEDDLLIDPSITDELMPEIVAQIIHDLQSDPSIRTMMDSIENLEQEIPELEIDLPGPDDRLEEESVFW